jgi:hypothetical protein
LGAEQHHLEHGRADRVERHALDHLDGVRAAGTGGAQIDEGRPHGRVAHQDVEGIAERRRGDDCRARRPVRTAVERRADQEPPVRRRGALQVGQLPQLHAHGDLVVGIGHARPGHQSRPPGRRRAEAAENQAVVRGRHRQRQDGRLVAHGVE